MECDRVCGHPLHHHSRNLFNRQCELDNDFSNSARSVPRIVVSRGAGRTAQGISGIVNTTRHGFHADCV